MIILCGTQCTRGLRPEYLSYSSRLPYLLEIDVFLMVKRKKTTMFIDAKENTTVLELKKMVEGIIKRTPEDQMLCHGKDQDQILSADNKKLEDYGLTSQNAQAQSPYLLGLRCRQEDGEFEALEIADLSIPRELPAPMKQHQDSSANKP